MFLQKVNIPVSTNSFPSKKSVRLFLVNKEMKNNVGFIDIERMG